MIVARSLQSLYAKHKAEIIALVYNEQKKPTDFTGLSVVYLDKAGRKYYHWENPDDIPVERYGKMLEYMQYIAKGLTAQEDEKLDDEIESALEDGLRNAKTKSAVRIGALLHERKARRKMCIHTELIYNYLLIQWVREDESPSAFDNEIQLQKVSTLKEENADGAASFFFQHRELKRLRDLLEMSKDDWEKYMNEYQIQVTRLQELLSRTASSRLSNEQDTTSVK